ncbi:hypothetical protein RRG08_026717 [Elysia crispata]|uniref:Uncharacterized protein n=1 Tax=Elysia crispata TaxID=231223 RepID=A0AAE0XVB1_9GAST|nr:hypothetical protein RRG08_026717 [Elysia crispata]
MPESNLILFMINSLDPYFNKSITINMGMVTEGQSSVGTNDMRTIHRGRYPSVQVMEFYQCQALSLEMVQPMWPAGRGAMPQKET